MTERPFMVIYPRGDRTTLSTAYVRDYQEDEWALASKQRFDAEEDAQKLAIELARKHNLKLHEDVPFMLDEFDPLTPKNAPQYLYIWKSEALGNATINGALVVMAESLEQARRHAKDYLYRYHPLCDMSFDLDQAERDINGTPELLPRNVAVFRP